MPSDQIEKSLINFEEDDRTLDRSAVDPMSELVLNLSGFEGPIDVY